MIRQSAQESLPFVVAGRRPDAERRLEKRVRGIFAAAVETAIETSALEASKSSVRENVSTIDVFTGDDNATGRSKTKTKMNQRRKLHQSH